MELRTFVAGMIGIVWLASAAHADPYVVDAFACNDGNAINGVSVDDVTGNNGGASDCFGTFDKNDPGPSGDGISLGGTVFEFISKVDVNDDGSQVPHDKEEHGDFIGLQIYDFTDDMCLAPGGTGGMGGAASSGCWAYDPDLFSAKAFFVVLKAADSPGWAAFLFEDGDAASWFGEWSIGWRPNRGACEGHGGSGNCAAISHIGIYALDGRVVPEPGTLGLLGLGLVGLGMMRRRMAKETRNPRAPIT